jgi:hypothetical protein
MPSHAIEVVYLDLISQLPVKSTPWHKISGIKALTLLLQYPNTIIHLLIDGYLDANHYLYLRSGFNITTHLLELFHIKDKTTKLVINLHQKNDKPCFYQVDLYAGKPSWIPLDGEDRFGNPNEAIVIDQFNATENKWILCRKGHVRWGQQQFHYLHIDTNGCINQHANKQTYQLIHQALLHRQIKTRLKRKKTKPLILKTIFEETNQQDSDRTKKLAQSPISNKNRLGLQR